MGIIKRQGFKSTLVNYFGVLVGTVAILFVYPLDDEIYGYANWLYNTSYLLIPLASGGVLSLVVKYFPAFNKEGSKNYNGFLTLILTLIISVFGVFLILWFLFKGTLMRFMELLNMNINAIQLYEPYILILLFVLIIFIFLLNQSFNQFRIVVPNLVQQVGYKLYLPVLVLIYIHFQLNKEQFSYLLIAYFVMAIVVMLIYLKKLGALKFGKVVKPSSIFSYREMASYSFFGSLNGISNSLAFRIDNVMIPFLLDMAKNGVYNKVFFIANVIEMPTRAMNQITAPIISKAWENNDMEEIKMVYKKASTNLYLIGCFFFLIIWYVLDDLIAISSNPDAFPNARMIFLFLASSKLIDMLMSMNTQIITYSKAYKYNLIFMMVLGVSNLTLNYLFINKFGLVGAAIATASSLLLYNIIKLIFIRIRFGIHPFSVSTLKTSFLFGLFLLMFYYLQFDMAPLYNLVIKCALILVIFGSIAYSWNISPDINSMIRNFISKINYKR